VESGPTAGRRPPWHLLPYVTEAEKAGREDGMKGGRPAPRRC
jgi:hypothetical protein